MSDAQKVTGEREMTKEELDKFYKDKANVELTKAEQEQILKQHLAETKKHLKTLGKNELIRIVLGTLMQLQYTSAHLDALKAKYLVNSEDRQKKEEKNA